MDSSNKTHVSPEGLGAIESPTDQCLRVIVGICRAHAEMTLAQIEASLPANPPVPVYATRTQRNVFDGKLDK